MLEFTIENELYAEGFTAVCGVDEAGRGPLCGPVVAAACILPLPKHTAVDSELGTRHRAAVGLSEVSDAVIIVVSEETGVISIARDGKISRYLSLDNLERILTEMYTPKEEPSIFKSISKFFVKEQENGKAE